MWVAGFFHSRWLHAFRPLAHEISSPENVFRLAALRARLLGPTWGPSGADRTQVGPMLAPWTLLSGWPFVRWMTGGLPSQRAKYAHLGVLLFSWQLEMVLNKQSSFQWVENLLNDAIWRHRSGSTLARAMACCLTIPRHYLNPYIEPIFYYHVRAFSQEILMISVWKMSLVGKDWPIGLLYWITTSIHRIWQAGGGNFPFSAPQCYHWKVVIRPVYRHLWPRTLSKQHLVPFVTTKLVLRQLFVLSEILNVHVWKNGND